MFPEHRYDDDRSGSGKIGNCNNRWVSLNVHRKGLGVFYVNHFMGAGNGTEWTLWVWPDQRVRIFFGVGLWHVVEGDGTKSTVLIETHRTKVCTTNACCVIQHALEHRLQFARRGADHFKNFRGRCLLLKGLREVARLGLHLVEQTYVTNGDHGLVREGLQHADLLVAERVNLKAAQRNSSDASALAQQWNA